MTFHVAWAPPAFDWMAGTIRRHPEYKALFAAVLRDIDAALRESPGSTGESRGDGFRIGFFDPFVIDFQVLPADRQVRVLAVRLRTYLI